MSSIKSGLNSFLKICTLVSTSALIITVCVQIFSRFLLESSPSWTEEASRFFFIYSVSFAAGLGWNEGYFIGMDLFYEKLSTTIQKVIDYVSNILLLMMLIIMTIYSVQLIILGHAEISPSLNIKMSFALTSMLILSLSILIFTIFKLFPSTKQK